MIGVVLRLFVVVFVCTEFASLIYPFKCQNRDEKKKTFLKSNAQMDELIDEPMQLLIVPHIPSTLKPLSFSFSSFLFFLFFFLSISYLPLTILLFLPLFCILLSPSFLPSFPLLTSLTLLLLRAYSLFFCSFVSLYFGS